MYSKNQKKNFQNIFKPKFSIAGWVSNLLFPISLIIIIIFIFQSSIVINAFSYVTIIPLTIALIVFVFFGAIYPTMKYIVTKDYIVAKCGPFRYRIKIDSIIEIKEVNLKYLPISEGWKLPGYALFSISYGNVNKKVKMCSTSITKKIMILRIENGDIYGINPDDSHGFIQCVKSNNMQ